MLTALWGLCGEGYVGPRPLSGGLAFQGGLLIPCLNQDSSCLGERGPLPRGSELSFPL